jgi:cytochrome c oxidase subunit 3
MSEPAAVHTEEQSISNHKSPLFGLEINYLGMWLFLAGEVMFFGALFTGYMVYRLNYPQVFAEAGGFLDRTLGTINTGVLLTSSLAMALAVNAAQRSQKRSLVLFLWLTILLGLVFLGIKGSEYMHKFQEGLWPGGDFIWNGTEPQKARAFFSLYFIMTGLHALHMIIGILALAVLSLFGLRGRFTALTYAPVEMVGLFWHFVDIVWIFLFPMLYLIHR